MLCCPPSIYPRPSILNAYILRHRILRFTHFLHPFDDFLATLHTLQQLISLVISTNFYVIVSCHIVMPHRHVILSCHLVIHISHYITNLIRIHLDNIYVTTKQQRSLQLHKSIHICKLNYNCEHSESVV